MAKAISNLRDETPIPPHSDELLAWYDSHARVLPWRVPPGSGEAPDPYRIWLSEVMLQQTTVATVIRYFNRFTALWPRVEDLAAANEAQVLEEWAGLGYYARARNLLKAARQVHAQGGFPNSQAALRDLPGIGPYTSAAIAAIAFDQPAVVVDGNVERVMARIFDIHTPLPRAKPELTEKAACLTPAHRPGDYAQAVMDLGATICTPTSPTCGICPWRKGCRAHAAGTAALLPRKLAKKPKPTRKGTVWAARLPDGRVLLERRPPMGLLGGMLAFPSTGWDGESAPPLAGDWRDTGVTVRHTFTHFHLELRVLLLELERPVQAARGEFLLPRGLPTAMVKVAEVAAKVGAQAERDAGGALRLTQ